ncbi:MAG: FAD:protein FMN transferase [Lysobacteraceae bacterium]|nr:MAG: FAD:protein FMN transferase [Xanthomonadaceae bacterium]
MPSPSRGNEPDPWAIARPLLGTLVAIRIIEPGAADPSALEAAMAEIAAIDRAMSFHRPDSELSRINREAVDRPQRLSAPMLRVMRAALALARASRGAFDPSVAGRLVAWGRLPAPPGAPCPDPTASWRDIELGSDGRLRLRRPLWLDLGGIAKGHAVDRAIARLRRAGVRAATVNAGGDLRSFGHRHLVHVRDPACPTRTRPLLWLEDAAVATSGGYLDPGARRTALVVPQRGVSTGRHRSVSVCARRAIWADALTKVVMVDPKRSAVLLPRLGARALVLDRRGRAREIA